MVAVAGEEHPDWLDYTLGLVADIATTITPWSEWVAAPEFQNPKTVASVPDPCWGKAFCPSGRAAIRSSLGAVAAVETAFHEAWHLCETHMTQAEFQAVADGIQELPELPRGQWNDYYVKPEEVRANAFEQWAMSYWLRGRQPEYRRGMPADERVWVAAYRGDIGLRVTRQGGVPRGRMPLHLVQRMHERGGLVKAYDVIGNGTFTAWEWLVGAVSKAPPGTQPVIAKRNLLTATKAR